MYWDNVDFTGSPEPKAQIREESNEQQHQAPPKQKRAATTCSCCHKEGHNKTSCPENPNFIQPGNRNKKAKPSEIVAQVPLLQNRAPNDEEIVSDDDLDISDAAIDQVLVDEHEINAAKNDDDEIIPDQNVPNHVPRPSLWEEIEISERSEKELRSGEIVKDDPCPPFKPLHKVGPLKCEGCDTPLSFFKLFISDAIVTEIVRESNSYAISSKMTTMTPILVAEMWTFIAIVLFMGIVVVPERNYLWGAGVFASEYIKKHMSLRRFEQILRAFHWIDTTKITKTSQNVNNKKDHFWRIRGFVDLITTSSKAHFQCGQKVDIDEQTVPFKGRHPSKCYNPNKPYKWHLKIYAANDAATSYQVNQLLYQGKDEKRDKDLTATEYPVHYLMNEDIFKYRNHILFCDNWYSSVNVVLICLVWGIHFVGTIKTNRSGLPQPGILPYKGTGVKARGFMHGFVKELKGFLVYFYAWQDSKPVHMISTIKSTRQEITRNNRDSAGNYRRLLLPQPTIIWLYNQGMGGTDSFDQKISMYRTNLKVLAWHKKLMFHFVQISVVNAHILLKETFKLERNDNNFTLLIFMENLVEEIFSTCYKDKPIIEVDGDEEVEPLVVNNASSSNFSRTNTIINTSNRLTGNHFPVQYESRNGPDSKDNRRRCRICNKKSSVKCSNSKCDVALCINDCGEEPNCWAKFHK